MKNPMMIIFTKMGDPEPLEHRATNPRVDPSFLPRIGEGVRFNGWDETLYVAAVIWDYSTEEIHVCLVDQGQADSLMKVIR
jgi:hypothetical protein